MRWMILSLLVSEIAIFIYLASKINIRHFLCSPSSHHSHLPEDFQRQHSQWTPVPPPLPLVHPSHNSQRHRFRTAALMTSFPYLNVTGVFHILCLEWSLKWLIWFRGLWIIGCLPFPLASLPVTLLSLTEMPVPLALPFFLKLSERLLLGRWMCHSFGRGGFNQTLHLEYSLPSCKLHLREQEGISTLVVHWTLHFASIEQLW